MIPREFLIIAFVAPLIITPVIIIIFFKLMFELQNAKTEVQTLSGLLPICARCKKVRDDKGYWDNLESYIEKYSNASFSHSMCKECSDELYGNENWYKKMKKKKKYNHGWPGKGSTMIYSFSALNERI